MCSQGKTHKMQSPEIQAWNALRAILRIACADLFVLTNALQTTILLGYRDSANSGLVATIAGTIAFAPS